MGSNQESWTTEKLPVPKIPKSANVVSRQTVVPLPDIQSCLTMATELLRGFAKDAALWFLILVEIF